MPPKLPEAALAGQDRFLKENAPITARITRIKARPWEPDAIMLFTMMPGGCSAIRPLRAAGVSSMSLAGPGIDGSDWLSAVPDLSDFFTPVQGPVCGDDPNPGVTGAGLPRNTPVRRCEDRGPFQSGRARRHHLNRRRGGGTGEDEG
ncbi:hypothetical protein XINFAN_03767 [Pseudogemmobacter humi]|uniref:Uncharacterized protein n=1 Tax=Pseudogemmobacter humi TaxID=2483812 RepID=A0A3P5XNQ4_9RHOB|nr:hypothetical protein XINFAN_03767 [Pseudogemmobacter humi]